MSSEGARDAVALPPGLRHVAMIMDGNGRWAGLRGLPRAQGHREGANSVRELTTILAASGLEQLTLYALSVENFQKRPRSEIDFLLGLLGEFLESERPTIMENRIRFRAIGRIAEFPESLRDRIAKLEADSADNGGMVLCLALNYGGRTEIADAARRVARRVAAGDIPLEEVDEETLARHLYDPDMPELDLMIRTAGEMRVSNFLLWQVSYAEIYVTEEFWPEFRRDALVRALSSFRGRERRFGGLAERLDV
ncbi:MAG: polyprenyl diphosphate synthase [Planctomycetota bacterium]